jgi:hypothetical protein
MLSTSVIPGLVPGINRGTGGNLGPRDKPGDDGFWWRGRIEALAARFQREWQ